jgi:hypothetical protein
MKTSNSIRIAIAALAWQLASPAPVRAADPAAPESWKIDGEIYLWGASIGATTVTGGDIDVGFDTIMKNLDMAFMGALGARKGKWSIVVDAIYMDVSADRTGAIALPDGSVATSSNLVLKSWVVGPSAGYNVVDTGAFTLDVLAGARYLYLKPTLSAQVDGPLEGRFRQFSDSANIWNGIVGVRGRVSLCPRWFFPYYADIGAGASKLTWQASGGVGYGFGWIEVTAAYRYLDWNLKNLKVFDDLNFGGPLLGAKIYF